jgi:hypothetical protein
MSFKNKANLGGVISTKKQSKAKLPKPQIGKVYGVITTPNTPNKELYEQYGKEAGIGTIFYLDHDKSKNKNKKDIQLSSCKSALPYYSDNQNYPLIEELVWLINGPSIATQLGNTPGQKFYLGSLNSWNSSQQNAPSGDSLGKTFIESSTVKNLQIFEGDRLYPGRKGNGIRFGSTVKYHSNLNEWSSIGDDGDPITTLVNGYYQDKEKKLHIENINDDLSSIYLTSTQVIPLKPGANIINKTFFTPTTTPEHYLSSQIILNSDRVTLNSKKDEVLLFAKTNIELSTDNITNFNSGQRIHLNSPVIWLGKDSKLNSQPTEPLLLGNKTKKVLTDLVFAVNELGNALTSLITTPQGSPLTGANVAGAKLSKKMVAIQKQLKNIASTNNFTI